MLRIRRRLIWINRIRGRPRAAAGRFDSPRDGA